jgi:hypothetical protein
MQTFRHLTFLIGMVLTLFAQKVNSQVQTSRFKSITSNSKAFYEYLPQGYNATGTETYPLIIFMHGQGEQGDGSSTSLTKLLRTGLPRVINQGAFPVSFTVNSKAHKFIVISPQFVNWPTSSDIDAVISYAISNYKVDPSRVYLSGLSMGGGAVWEYAGHETNINYPKRLAAIVPVCGASWPNSYRGKVIANNNIATWAFHNDGDPTVPLFYTNDYVKYINATVPAPVTPAKKTIFVSTSHDAWTKAYDPNYRENGLNIYEWMLQYAKGGVVVTPPANTPPIVNAGLDKTITLPINSLQLTSTASDPNGSIVSYSWQKVAGPSQFTFSSATIGSPTVSNLVQGTYTFRITVKDNAGATTSDDLNVTVNAAVTNPNPTPVPNTSVKYVKVNMFGDSNPYTNSEWNNWNSYNLSSPTFKYSNGTASAISAKLSAQSGISDNGPTYSSTLAAKEVIRYASYATSNRTLTFSGLDNAKTYDLEFYASRSGVTNNTTRYIIGSKTIDVISDNNSTNKALFTGIKPTSGQIVVTVNKLLNYNYINGFILTEKSSSTTSTVASAAENTELSEVTANASLDVFPNPVKDRFVLQINNAYTGRFKVQVIDMNGVIHKEMNLTKNNSGSNQTYLSIGELLQGEYLIRVQGGDWSETKKISKL